MALGLGAYFHADHSFFLNLLKQEDPQHHPQGFSMASSQPNRLYQNLGDGTFVEVGFFAGVDSFSDGYMATLVDLNSDSKPDLILRNTNPGTQSISYPSLEIFYNQQQKAHLISLRIEDLKGHIAYGAKIKAYQKNRLISYQELMSSSGTIQGSGDLYIGLGQSQILDRLEIYWRKNLKKTYTNVKEGHYLFKEPALPLLKRT
jgi:hypothetical protein